MLKNPAFSDTQTVSGKPIATLHKFETDIKLINQKNKMTNKTLVFLAVLLLTVTTLQAQTTKLVKQMAYADSLRLV